MENKGGWNKVYPLYLNTAIGILGVGCGLTLFCLSLVHVNLNIRDLLDINGVIAITGVAYVFMGIILRTICLWITMLILSRKLYNGGMTINELALTTDFCHGQWFNIFKLSLKWTILLIGCDILLQVVDVSYKFGVQLGNSYGVENYITNTNSINGGLFKTATCDGNNLVECLTDTALNTLIDGVSTTDSSTLDNWGFLQPFIWQESRNVIYVVPHRPFINANALNQVTMPNLNDHNVVSKILNAQAQAIVRIEVKNASNVNGWDSYGNVVVHCNGNFLYNTWNDTKTPIGDTIVIDGWSNCTPNHHHMEIHMELCNGTAEWTIEPRQPIQAWNITNLSNLYCGPIGINTTKGKEMIYNMESNGGLYGLDNRAFSLTPIDGADAILSGKQVQGFEITRLELSKIYIWQRIQVAINVLAYVQNSWPGKSSEYLQINATTVKYLRSTIQYNLINIIIAGIMTVLIFSGTIFLALQTYRITWAGTIGQTVGLLIGKISESLPSGTCVDNMPKDDGHGELYYVCSTVKLGVRHLELSTSPNEAIPELEGLWCERSKGNKLIDYLLNCISSLKKFKVTKKNT